MQIESLVAPALRSFHADLGAGGWFGRENEVVNLFAFGHLLPRLAAAQVAPTQLGIEVAVPQIPRADHPRRRPDVRKDLVIWPEPRMTCWRSPTENRQRPSAVLEWKTRNNTRPRRSLAAASRAHALDIEWLREFALQDDDAFVGLAIFVDLTPTVPVLRAAHVTRAATDVSWLDLGGP